MAVEHRISEHSPERATPEEMSGRLMESEHRGRYLWAAQMAEGRNVLDAGCGTGYGTDILAAAGASDAVGVDISSDAIEHARSLTSRASVEFVLGDLHELPFADHAFDLVVCFEAIEHVDDQARVITELKRVLRPDGLLVLSSPNRHVYPPGNPYHTHEFTPEELDEALHDVFSNVRLYLQSPWLAAAVFDAPQSRGVGVDASMLVRTIKIGAVAPGAEVFTIALASNVDLPAPEALALMGEPFEVGWWESQLAGAERALEREQQERGRERAEHDRQRAELGRAILAAENELAAALDQVARLEAAEEDLKKWAGEQVAEREELLRRSNQDRHDLENRLGRAERTISDVTGSPSWRITSPLRVLKRMFNGR
jgi:SAM-dependent methyltransferase